MMKREEKDRTGIYIKTTKTASVHGKSNKPTKQGTKDVADLMFECAKAAGESYRTFLDAAERDAKVIAESDDFLDTQRADAQAVLRDLTSLRQSIDSGNAYQAAFLAITIGRTYERMMIRPFEALVRIGRKQREYLAKGRQTKAELTEEKYQLIRVMVKQMMMEKPRISETEARKQVADKLSDEHGPGFDYRTVLRAFGKKKHLKVVVPHN